LSEKIFNEPRIALNRVYTRAGDSGETRLLGGQCVPKRVPKDDARIDYFGVVDELNAFLGLARMTDRWAALTASFLGSSSP
jgi:cob(I)alamin adenosyltransferase